MPRGLPIVVQLIAGFSAILIMVLAVTAYYSYLNSSKVVLEKTAIYLNESVNQLVGKIDVNLKEYDKATQLIAFSSTFQSYFRDVNEGRPSATSKLELSQYMGQQIRYFALDSVIHVTDLRDDFHTSNDMISMLYSTESEMRKHFSWFELVDDYRGRMLWVASSAWRYGEFPAFIGARQVNDWEELNKLGNLFIIMPVTSLGRLVGEFNVSIAGKIMIFDSLGGVIFSSDDEDFGSMADPALLSRLEDNPGRMFEWTIDDTPVYVSHASSDYSGWDVVAFINADEAVADLLGIRKSITIIGGVGILTALLFISFFAWTLSRPIALLARKLSRLEKGFIRPYNRLTGNRELAILYDSYNQMIKRLDKTVKALSDKEISETQAQVVALKAQFRPHFLYNSLNTIYWTLYNDGQQRSADMVLMLSDLLRYSIQPGSDLVEVEVELAQLERYIAISKLRYGEKLQTEVNVDEHVMGAKMMKMLLQPLVENAITHGLEEKKGDWLIRITIVQVDDQLHLTVEDNGVGMTQQEIDDVLVRKSQVMADEMIHTGIGLSNLYNRISLTYGTSFDFKLSEGAEGGLKVDIIIPLIWDEGVVEEHDETDR